MLYIDMSGNNTTPPSLYISLFYRMTKATLKALCRKHDLYSVPELNDVLYLHFQGRPCSIVVRRERGREGKGGEGKEGNGREEIKIWVHPSYITVSRKLIPIRLHLSR